MITEREIARRLRAGMLEPEVRTEARDAAVAAATTRLRERAAPRSPSAPEREPRSTLSKRPSAWRSGIRPALVTLLLLAVVFLAATPTGRSIAREIGELVGIGDEPTGEPLFEAPDTVLREIVIGVGESPSGARYEVIAETATADGRTVPCFRVSFPDFGPRGAMQCLTAAALRSFTPDSITPIAYAGADGSAMVAGITGADIARVELSDQDGSRGADVALFSLEPELAAAIATDVEASYFVTFPAESPGTAEVIGLDDVGTELARKSVNVPAAREPSAPVEP